MRKLFAILLLLCLPVECWAAYTEFYCNASTGHNNNGGSDENTSPSYTHTNGSWDSSTGVYTPTSGDPSSSGVSVGQYASVFNDGSPTTAVFIGRVTAVSSTTITVSTTIKVGTAPTTNATGRSINVGGCWKGPNSTDGFPLTLAAHTLRSATTSPTRINLKNNATYSVTAAIANSSVAGSVVFQGYASTAGDYGKFILDGGTSGASYVVLNFSGQGVILRDAEIRNNGATGSATLFTFSAVYGALQRAAIHDSRGYCLSSSGGSTSQFDEVEVYAGNKSNTSGLAGASCGAANTYRNCKIHSNTGSNTYGITGTISAAQFINCIIANNGNRGFSSTSARASYSFINCDFYGNGNTAIFVDINIAPMFLNVVNTNFLANAGYAIEIEGSDDSTALLVNCGFGTGTMANSSGTHPSDSRYEEIGTVTYASNTHPYNDPSTGDFDIVLSAAKGTGRGVFTELAPSYSGTVGYPDIGAAQHQDTGGSSGSPPFSIGIGN